MKSFVLAFLTLITFSVSAQTVQDGDSIIRGDGVRVRLYGIDAPEKGPQTIHASCRQDEGVRRRPLRTSYR